MTITTLPEADAALLALQARGIKACLDQLIPADRPVALLQFPLDSNVGNHMMWLAITNYLAARGIKTAYAANEWNINIADLVKAIGDGTILFLGGVTVSRLWPGHAEVKRMVAAACPRNRLISLPSTMLFVDDEDRRESAAIFGDHRDVVMMARDPVSAASAQEVFQAPVSVMTLHDTAFMLPLQPRHRPSIVHDVIWLARNDREKTESTPPDGVKVFDWPPLDRAAQALMFPARIGSRLRRASPLLGPAANAMISESYRAVSRHVVAHGNMPLDQGRVLVTDRLHPHVFAVLRGQPCVLLPDKFGKNRAVWEFSSRHYSMIHWADTPEQGLELARALAATLR